MLADVPQDRWSNGEVAVTSGNSFADCRGGNGKFQSIQFADSRVRRGLVTSARAGDDDEFHKPNHILPSAPGANIGKGIGADQKGERSAAEGQKLFSRVDRIARIR